MREIRPSSLPKLAECPVFEGAEGYSEAASRGTKIDKAIRDIVAGGAMDETLSSEDQEVVRWGALELMALAKGAKVETREEYLAMHIPGLSASGTADAICEKQKWVADIKTGQVRNYREQLAAYALACMDASWDASWTAHVIYVDQRLVRSYEFTREQAERIVQGVIGLATSPLASPRPCEYCSWCKHRDSCSALVHQSAAAIADIRATNAETLTAMRERILEDPQRHSDFVRRYKFFVDEFGEPLTDALKQRLIDGEEVDGWKLTNPKPRRYVEPSDILPIIKKMTPEHVFFATGGKISADNFVEAATSLGIENPENLVKSAPGTPQMRQSKTKQKDN